MMQYSIIKAIGIAAVTLMLTVSVCQAEKRYDEQGDEVTYGSLFHEGQLDGIDIKEEGAFVSIDDTAYMIGEEALLKDSNNTIISIGNFELGDFVKYYEVDKVITKMWKAIKAVDQEEGQSVSGNGDQETNDSALPSSAGEGELKLENGVWTN